MFSLCGSQFFRVERPKCMELPLWVYPMAAFLLQYYLFLGRQGGGWPAQVRVACLPQVARVQFAGLPLDPCQWGSTLGPDSF